MTEELIRKVNPNHIILATGANPIMPKIPGINLPHVVQANDILSGKELMKNNAVVIGGGLVGAEVVEQYGEHVRGVTVVEMTSEIAGGMEMAPKKFLMKHLNESRVKLMVNTKVIEIKANSVVIECEGKIEEIGAEQVVIAIGSKSENILEPLIKDKYKYHVIGDATKVGRALEAIEMGYVAGISI
ncbi:NAD(P)/FAD-dependent oxidoreductase [Clostridium butyricum]|uniref:NAD(P)/FAD-dependent oxidoreductase n=1 Tax=Clostridium butyricum TaxID=1492 RepID=UPI00168B0968